jgi:hypothetical protein
MSDPAPFMAHPDHQTRSQDNRDSRDCCGRTQFCIIFSGEEPAERGMTGRDKSRHERKLSGSIFSARPVLNFHLATNTAHANLSFTCNLINIVNNIRFIKSL